ncbi:hypothetical protein A3D78_04395 [Candidatus Gottesmanbacteria bacterium RIFCSPHIGHO2_02_FULL_39_14]|uniref:Uncharacterized protein n=2 Tax=Candidatus Gottesmaniibacteriota TaxID=1752720 RepID=A0A1F6A364_9BACT|nr:MAG: hypothetical protein A3D78_04395 [Candidatus Gottesmanbacteria bacterium RIFCSPHIGHO2_02_FULL_39_14]OGG30845.1 MAG: hypothetical protein A3I51_01425 [Candidatus Gottesmanbacteria bacterium RIFCSPLOWO2_02_FULL_38_8]
MAIFKKLTALFTPFVFLSFNSPVLANGITFTIPTPPNLRVTNLGKLISGLIGAILVIATLAAFIYLLIGGFQWITSGGDKSAVESAQKRIQAAIIGLIIVFAAWALMIIVGKFFGIDNIFDLVIPSGV